MGLNCRFRNNLFCVTIKGRTYFLCCINKNLLSIIESKALYTVLQLAVGTQCHTLLKIKVYSILLCDFSIKQRHFVVDLYILVNFTRLSSLCQNLKGNIYPLV